MAAEWTRIRLSTAEDIAVVNALLYRGVRVIFSATGGRFEGVIDGEPYQLNDVWMVSLRELVEFNRTGTLHSVNLGALDIIS